MIAAPIVALVLALALAGETPGVEPSPPRFGVSLGAGVGLGMRRPLATEGLARMHVRPSAAVHVSATPWIERPAGHGLAVRVPLSYETTLAATALEQGPGLEGTRRVRSQRLELAVDVLAALDRRRHTWLGAGVLGSHTALDLASPYGRSVGHGIGLVAVRVPAVLALGRGVVVIGTAPAIGVALGDPRVAAMGVPRVGLGLEVTSFVHVRLARRLGLAIHHTEQHARAWGPSGPQSDHWRIITAGLVLTGRSPSDDRERSRSVPPVRVAHDDDRVPPAIDPAPRPVATEADAEADAAPPTEPISARPPAPALAGTTLTGEPLDLASLRGRVVVVDFWASWCAPCRESMPRLQALQDELGNQVVVLGISVDEAEADARAFLDEAGIAFPVILDPEQQHAATWEPPKMPTTFVVDCRGRLASVHAGYEPGDTEALRAEVQRLAAEDPPQ